MKKVHYINLDERTDRRQQFLNEMRRYGLQAPDQVVRFPAVKHDPGYVGCSWSHVGVLRQALKENDGSAYVAIFEDDFMWKISPPDQVNQVLKGFFEKVREWDVLLLAAPIYNLHLGPLTPAVPGVMRCTRSQTTTAYLVRRGYIETLLALFEESAKQLEAGGDYNTWALDQLWHKLQERDNWFITIPGVAQQRPSYSDIEKKHVEYPFI